MCTRRTLDTPGLAMETQSSTDALLLSRHSGGYHRRIWRRGKWKGKGAYDTAPEDELALHPGTQDAQTDSVTDQHWRTKNEGRTGEETEEE